MALPLPQIMFFGLMIWLNISLSTTTSYWYKLSRRGKIAQPGNTSPTGLECKNPQAFGMENGKILDSQLTASSAWNGYFNAANGGRLNSYVHGNRRDAWVVRRGDINPWVQVDLKQPKIITKIATQGRKVYNQWVKTYTISYSNDGMHFNFYKQNGRIKVFNGNTDRNTVAYNVLSPAIMARYVRINPKTWKNYCSMRTEIYGCFKEPEPCDSKPCQNGGVCTNEGDAFSCKCVEGYLGKSCEGVLGCGNPQALGMENGKILGSQLTSSSAWSSVYNAANGGRLNSIVAGNRRDAWVPAQRDKNPWLQVDFRRRGIITMIGTQGRQNNYQWVKTYTVLYSNNGKDFTSYKPNGKTKVFSGNRDRTTVVRNALSPPIEARYVRVHPLDCSRYCSLRVEFYGCLKALQPCDSSPCKNGGVCTNKGDTFSCRCRPYFIGSTCEGVIPNACSPNPCRNGGHCEVLGNGFACRCKPEFGGPNCEHGQSTCSAQGDPHYSTFDGRRYNFQGSKCDYIFAQDCGSSKGRKKFTVVTRNQRCGGRVSCVAAVTVYLAGDEIRFSRALRTVVINGVKLTTFPVVRPGFVIANPSLRWLQLTTDIGLTVSWDCRMQIKVTVSGAYKEKTCGLCGNNDGEIQNDQQIDVNQNCAPPPNELVCRPNEETRSKIDKCELMSNPQSPFMACHSTIDPTQLISDCKYDACRCDDPMGCVCASFASYTKQCSAYGKIINWRFRGTYLYKPLEQCAQQCNNAGEIFTECGSSCAQTCRDLSLDIPIKCNEECIPGCQCPKGQFLNDKEQCIPVEQCPCNYEGKIVEPGESVDVGNCKTCTCSAGAMACVDDKKCLSKGPCDSMPCKNQGICSVKGDSFSCQCIGDYQGKTCQELKPKPCDSKPCKNGGVCTNEEDLFSCECAEDYQGKTCEGIFANG